MRRIALQLALIAFVAAGCGQGKGTGTTGSSSAKGTPGIDWYVQIGSKPVGGTITSDVGGINCGTGGSACGNTRFLWATTTVTLTATPDAGYTFRGWAGDCSGTASTCTFTRNDGALDFIATAAFDGVGTLPPPPPPDNTVGRVYGYVKDGAGKGASGVTVSLNTTPVTTATTTAAGAYVFEVAPGAYTLTTTANSQFLAATPVNVTLSKVTDGTCVRGFYVPTAGVATAPGCLLRVADIAVAGNPAYVAPALPTVTASKKYLAGFGQQVTLDCTPGGTNAFSKWVQTSGPTTVSTTGWTQNGQVFTTPTFGALVAVVPDAVKCPAGAGLTSPNAKVGCGVSNLVLEGRPGFVSFNKQQAGELTYTFQCQTTDGTNTISNTVNVQLASFVNANTATMTRETPQPQSVTNKVFNALGQPPVLGPLWGAQSEQFTVQADGATWRAHDGVNVPSGVIVVTDDKPGRASYNWKFCGTAKDTATSCSAIPVSVLNVPTINDANTPNAWFVVSWTPGKTLYLVNDALPITVSGFAGKAAMPIKSANWTGFYNATVAEPCSVCHLPPGLPDGTGGFELGPTAPSTEWQKSKHSGILVDGGSGTHYSASCLPCHTIGYDPAVSNGGWDDVAAAQAPGYKLPDFPFEGTDSQIFTKTMPTAVQAASNIQCESCHGPANAGPDHTASLNSRMCAYCHDGGHHGLYSQWRQSAHANLAGAQGEGPSHGRDQTHCGRCHFAQGFILYADAVKSGNPDKLGNPPPSGAPAGAITTGILCSPATTAQTDTCPNGQQAGLLTNENVEAISCQTCHDPHGLELRIKGDDTTAGITVAGGFSIQNAGSGAICAVCHNSRNGVVGALAPNPNNSGAPYAGIGGQVMARNDATPLTADSRTIPIGTAPAAVLGIGTPHSAAQADVYYGGNGYLLCNSNASSGPCALPAQPNFHRDPNWFKDTCAECHVKRFTAATQAAGTVVNHTFGVDDNTCASCHGAGNELSYRESFVAGKMASYLVAVKNVLNGAGIKVVNGKLNGAAAADYAVPAGVTITDVAVVEASRALGVDLTFSNGDKVTGCSIDKIYSDAAKTQPTLYSVSGTVKTYGKVAKSMYDYFLIKNDNSSGVHNIPFVDAMLDAMVNNLDSTGLPK